jgi:hypothetical protein
MSPARFFLHAAAAITAFGVVLAVSLWLAGFMIVGVAAVPAILASQAAAFAGWLVIDTYPDSPRAAPIGAGLMMAAVAHMTFGGFALLTMSSGGTFGNSVDDKISFVALAVTLSVVKGGWLTLPLAIAAAFKVHRMRRSEL